MKQCHGLGIHWLAVCEKLSPLYPIACVGVGDAPCPPRIPSVQFGQLFSVCSSIYLSTASRSEGSGAFICKIIPLCAPHVVQQDFREQNPRCGDSQNMNSSATSSEAILKIYSVLKKAKRLQVTMVLYSTSRLESSNKQQQTTTNNR